MIKQRSTATPDTATAEPAVMKRRRVHYFSGFDPRGAAHYHRLMREEGARPQVGGVRIETGPRRRASPHVHVWPVRSAAPTGATHVETEHVFMGWDDIVRANWPKGPLALLRTFWLAYVGIVRDVDLRRVRQIHPTVALTGVLPAVFLGGSLLVGVLVAILLMTVVGGLVGALAGMGLGAALVAAVWTYGQRKGVFWLLRIFAYVVRMSREPVPGMPERAKAWVEQIIASEKNDPVDEVLLVGHSVGALVLVDAVDMLLADPRWQALAGARKTCLLTLGQCLPFVALPPQAQPMRDALARLCEHPRLAWLDVTALIDPLCFHRAHPLALTGMEVGRENSPTVMSARFFQMYEPARWARLRRDKLMAHFLYLMTPDRPGNFNVYELLYGAGSFEAVVAQARRAPVGSRTAVADIGARVGA